MSRPTEDRAIVDAGLKALAFDSGPPLVCDEPAATYERASDEHGRLALSAATNRLGLGDKIRPCHCDPTVNLYDWCIRANRVEQLWPITARGRCIDVESDGSQPDIYYSDNCHLLPIEGGERGLYRVAMRLLHLHGRRLWPQPRP
jgi:Putative serine dehydratase domain